LGWFWGVGFEVRFWGGLRLWLVCFCGFLLLFLVFSVLGLLCGGFGIGWVLDSGRVVMAVFVDCFKNFELVVIRGFFGMGV